MPDDTNTILLDAALRYAREGLPIFPCRLGKHPYVKDWGNVASADEKQVRAWWQKWPDASIGMPTGFRSGRLVLDIDPRHGGDQSLAVMEEEFGRFPETLEVETGGGGRHFHFQLRGLDIRNSAGDLAPGIDVRGVGGYVVLPPSLHPSGSRYGWVNGNPVLDLPPFLEKKLLQLKPMPTGKNGAGARIPAGQRNRFLVSCAGRYRRAGDVPEVIFQKLKVDYATRCEQIPSVEDKELRGIAGWAERFTPEPQTFSGPPKASIPSTPLPQVEAVVLGSGREDTSNAQRFAKQHGETVRFWHGRNRWMRWTGTHWHDDSLAQIVELAKQTAKQIFVEASALPEAEAKSLAKWAERSLNRDKISAMLALAQSDPGIAAETSAWDSDPWALNFLNGTVDLKSGTLRPHRREDFITKLVRTNYTPDLVGPRWMQFLEQTFGEELAPWIQKAVGYSLVGLTVEKVAFLLYGETDTGKSTFLNTLREIFKDYSALIQIETLMWSKNSDNNTSADLADLRGARLAVTSETEEGQRLREAKLKRITQGMGDIKTARKYENPISFTETHKLWLDCNHAPMIRGTDDAIWNRIITIPCTHRVAVSDRDTELKNKLLHEAEAIASWAVAGAVRWRQEKLGRHELIDQVRNDWRETMDTIGQFLTERCIEEPGGMVRASELYETFRKWWPKDQGHEHIITAKAFGLRLAERKLKKDRDTKGNYYCDIRLRGGLF